MAAGRGQPATCLPVMVLQLQPRPVRLISSAQPEGGRDCPAGVGGHCLWLVSTAAHLPPPSTHCVTLGLSPPLSCVFYKMGCIIPSLLAGWILGVSGDHVKELRGKHTGNRKQGAAAPGGVPCDPTGTTCAVILLATDQPWAASWGQPCHPSTAHASRSQEWCS